MYPAPVAQRRVTKLMLDRVGNLLYGERPNLVVGDRPEALPKIHLSAVRAQLRHVFATGQSTQMPQKDEQGVLPIVPGFGQGERLPI